MFTGHDGPAAMNVYRSVVIFTSDRTSGPVGSSPPESTNELKLIILSDAQTNLWYVQQADSSHFQENIFSHPCNILFCI